MRKMLLKRVGVVDEGLANHGPRVKSSSLPASINKAYWDTATPIHPPVLPIDAVTFETLITVE